MEFLAFHVRFHVASNTSRFFQLRLRPGIVVTKCPLKTSLKNYLVFSRKDKCRSPISDSCLSWQTSHPTVAQKRKMPTCYSSHWVDSLHRAYRDVCMMSTWERLSVFETDMCLCFAGTKRERESVVNPFFGFFFFLKNTKKQASQSSEGHLRTANIMQAPF